MTRSTHQLKVTRPYMDALVSKRKPFEIRRNDRAFQTGDTLILHEAEKSCREVDRGEPCRFAGHRKVYATITFIFSGDPMLRDDGGIKPGYVVLGLKFKRLSA